MTFELEQCDKGLFYVYLEGYCIASQIVDRPAALDIMYTCCEEEGLKANDEITIEELADGGWGSEILTVEELGNAI